MSVPTFRFLNPFSQISGAQINKLLGTYGILCCRATNPSRIVTPNFISGGLNFDNAEMYISTISHASAKAAAQKALMAGRSRTVEGGVALSGSQVSK